MKSKHFIINILFSLIPFGVQAQNLVLNNTVPTQARKYLRFESNLGDSILYYHGFSVVYSYEYNLPKYLFSILTPSQVLLDSFHLPAKRKNIYSPEELPNGSFSATNSDYYKSGYDRGHMVPAGDFVWNQELKDETFTYTNINPQKASMNRGIWNDLEKSLREKVIDCHEDVYVITGVTFNSDLSDAIGPNGLCVPVAFFKIAFFEADTVMFAFLFDNTIEEYVGDITQFQVTVNAIEQITGEDFFDLMNKEEQEILESELIDFREF